MVIRTQGEYAKFNLNWQMLVIGTGTECEFWVKHMQILTSLLKPIVIFSVGSTLFNLCK